MPLQDTAVMLDVDGVVNPLWRPGATATRMRLDGAVGERIRRLAALGRVVWASTWDAATLMTISSTFGLPPLPVADAQDPLVRPASPNLTAVDAWLAVHEPPGGWRAVAWIDDELEGDARRWAREQPFLVQLTRPDPVQGLQDAHVERVEAFLRGVV